MEMPLRPYPNMPTSLHKVDDIWDPYPSQSGGLPAHLTQLANASSDLNRIIYDLSAVFFCEHKGLKDMTFFEVKEAANQLFIRLTKWNKSLEACLREGNSHTPHTLSLQQVLTYPAAVPGPLFLTKYPACTITQFS